jgi:hypothetical protein
MFKLNITHEGTYAEIDQNNPLRWRIMHRVKDTMKSQSHIIKCKDFFNDVVAWRMAKKELYIYRFSNKIKFNKYGVWLHLTNIDNMELFLSNMDVVNAKLKEQLDVSVRIEKHSDSELLIMIPSKVWSSTYYISLLSLAIRWCNYNIAYKTWEEMFNIDSPAYKAEDEACNEKTLGFVQKHGFAVDKAKELWYNAGHKYNSNSKEPVISSIVHDNGICGWVKALGV